MELDIPEDIPDLLDFPEDVMSDFGCLGARCVKLQMVDSMTNKISTFQTL